MELAVPEFGESMTIRLFQAASRIWADRRGQDLIEYALLVAGISFAAAAFLPQWVGPSISSIFSKVVSCMANVS